MATTIINPTPVNSGGSDNGLGFLLGAIILVGFGFIIIFYGYPMIQQGLNGLGKSGVQINLPKTVDVNVQQSK